MDFTAEFLARLQAGETADSLAAELTKAINDANKENERLKAEAEAKRKADEAAESRAREKADAIDNLLIALENIVAVWGLGDELIEAIEHVDPDEVVQEMDKIKDLMSKYDELFAAMAAPKAESKPQSALDEFLNKYVR